MDPFRRPALQQLPTAAGDVAVTGRFPVFKEREA